MIPGLSVRKGNQIASAMLAGLGLLFAYALWQALADRQSLKKYGVLVRSVVTNKQYPKGVGLFTVTFKYGGHYYYNTFRSSEFDCRLGDSVTIKINSINPMGYCVLSNDGSK